MKGRLFMSTKARIWYPNTVYHITARGIRKADIFKENEDFQKYMYLMKNTLEYFKNEYNIVCYCLMDNHIHIMIETKDIHYKYYITRVNSMYAKYFNSKYDYVGNLFQGRYFSGIINNQLHILVVSRYIHLNPVKANMVNVAEEYKWSSYSMYIGEKKEKLINSKSVLDYFKCRKEYKIFVETELQSS
jgi:REP element-mobilizing transposase RayT